MALITNTTAGDPTPVVLIAPLATPAPVVPPARPAPPAADGGDFVIPPLPPVAPPALPVAPPAKPSRRITPRFRPSRMRRVTGRVESLTQQRYNQIIEEIREKETVELLEENTFKQLLLDNNILYDFETKLLGGRIELSRTNIPFLLKNNIGIKLEEEKNPIEDNILENMGIWALYLRPSLLHQKTLQPILVEEIITAIEQRILQ